MKLLTPGHVPPRSHYILKFEDEVRTCRTWLGRSDNVVRTWQNFEHAQNKCEEDSVELGRSKNIVMAY